MEREISDFYRQFKRLQEELSIEERGYASAKEWLAEIDRLLCSKSGFNRISRSELIS